MPENTKEVIIKILAKEQGTKQVKKGFLAMRRAILSLMFTGYAVQKAMFGLLRPAFDLVGVFDMLNVTLGVVFLPIALALMEALLPIMEWFMNLDPAIQKVVGGLVLFVGSLGSIAALLGAGGAAITGLETLGTFFGLFSTTKAVSAIENVGTKAAASATGGITTLASKLSKVWDVVSLIGGGALVIKTTYDMFSRGDKPPTPKQFLSDIFGETVGGALMFGTGGALLGLTLALAVDFTKESFAKVEEQLKQLENKGGKIVTIDGTPIFAGNDKSITGGLNDMRTNPSSAPSLDQYSKTMQDIDFNAKLLQSLDQLTNKITNYNPDFVGPPIPPKYTVSLSPDLVANLTKNGVPTLS
jgi:hypothetical protein